MKFLQVGLGSMGTRRIRNLLFNKIKRNQIFGFDVSSSRCQEAAKKYNIKTSSNFFQAVREFKPDVFIISTPPDRHSEYFLYAAKNKKHFFVEPGTTDRGYKELFPLLTSDFVAAPACSLRYISAVQKIRQLVKAKKIGKILAFQYHSGQYLPDWHSWDDYRKFYFAKKETGACREMTPFELKWLNEIMGSKVKRVAGFTRKVSDLEMTADDIYAFTVEYENKIIGSVIIDLLARDSKITLRLIGSEGIIDWEWRDYAVRLFSAKDKTWRTIKLNKGKKEKNYDTPEDSHNLEIKDFLAALRGKKKFPVTFAEDYQLLKTLFALEKSSRTGKTIVL